MTSDTKIRVSPDVLFREIGPESVLAQVEGGEYFGLDEVGTRIWGLLTEERDVEAIVGTVTEEYDVEASVAEADVAALIQDLLRAGLVRQV
jgi:Coenzyme PQQ synthesis protein D (PqqD)